MINNYELDIEHMDLSFKGLNKFPDLTKFTKLRTLITFIVHIIN